MIDSNHHWLKWVLGFGWFATLYRHIASFSLFHFAIGYGNCDSIQSSNSDTFKYFCPTTQTHLTLETLYPCGVYMNNFITRMLVVISWFCSKAKAKKIQWITWAIEHDHVHWSEHLWRLRLVHQKNYFQQVR